MMLLQLGQLKRTTIIHLQIPICNATAFTALPFTKLCKQTRLQQQLTSPIAVPKLQLI